MVREFLTVYLSKLDESLKRIKSTAIKLFSHTSSIPSLDRGWWDPRQSVLKLYALTYLLAFID